MLRPPQAGSDFVLNEVKELTEVIPLYPPLLKGEKRGIWCPFLERNEGLLHAGRASVLSLK